MRKMKRTIELSPERTPELNLKSFLWGAMNFYRWYVNAAKAEAVRTGDPTREQWTHLLEKQQWQDVISLAHREGLIEGFDLSNFTMLLPNGDIIDGPVFEHVFVPKSEQSSSGPE